MIAVGIITAPRARPTLARSFQSYEAAGFAGSTHVFAEPGSQEIPMAANVMVHRNPERRGNFRNWTRALHQLLMVNEPWLMVCEDDIRWARNACAALQSELPAFERSARAGAISLYLPIRMGRVLEQQRGKLLAPGWYGLNLGRKTWGAQCLLFHRSWAETLLQDRLFLEFLADPKWDKNVDHLVAQSLESRGREIAYRVPCLVDHEFGDGNSSLGYKPDRPELRTRYFEGAAR